MVSNPVKARGQVSLVKLYDGTNGKDGKDGAQGVPGAPGADGKTTYVHFAYANSADGSVGFDVSDPTGRTYIGTYTDFTINDSTNYKSYTWSRMKGDTGNGIANTVIEYQITNTQDQPSDTSGWTTTIPNIGAGVYLWTRTTFVYTDGTKSRTYTVSRQSDNVYTAVLTNDSITIPADASGTVTDFSGSNGSFLVYDGAYQVDSSTITVQVAQQVNVTVAVGGNNYSITGMDKTKDSGYFDLSYTYKGVLLTKRVSVSKSKRGTDGSNPVIVNLSSTSQVFTFDSNNKPYPVNQNINFSTTVSGTNAIPVYSAIPYDGNGVAGPAIMLGNYGTGGKQLQVAQIGNYQSVVVKVTVAGGTDSTTIVRVKDGSSVSPIPDPSNTVSSATPPTNPKEGDWWNDTSRTPNVLKYRYRDKWVQYELDGYYVKANSISGEAIVTNTLEAQKIKYTNSDGTTTNLQTFDLKGMQTVMTDSSGHTYTSMDNAVSSTQTWKSTNNKLDNLQVGGRNLFILSTASKGWLDMSYNVTAPGDSSLASDFIPVTANTTYIAQQWYIMNHPAGSGYLRYAFYDSTKKPINRVPAPASNSDTYSKWIITTPANAAFIRMSFDYTANNWSKVKFEQGNLPTDWTEAPEDVATWTQAQISASAEQIKIGVSGAKSAADAATNKVNSLSVGARNLVLGTATDTVWTADSKDNYSFKVIKTGLKPGQTYTFSAEVTLGNTDQKITTLNLYNEPIGQWLASNDHFKADGTRDYWTFTVPTTVNTPTAGLIIYAGTPGSTGGKSVTYHHIKVETGNLPTDWTEAPEDVDGAIKKVSNDLKLTVDGYSLGTTVDGKLVSGFTGNQQQVTIKGNMVNLDANTVVGNNFILQSANIGDLTAGKIKTGSIVGNNLNINLDTGAVLFQKGRIYSQGKEIDINIDQNYIRSYGKFGSISLEDGAIYLSGPVYDKPIISDGPSIDLYLYIQSVLNPSISGQPDGYIGASIFAKDFLQIGLKDFPIGEWIPGQTSNNLGTIISRQTGTSVYGKDIGVNIAGGSVLNHPGGISFKTPRIAVGFNPTKDPTSMSTNPGDDLRSGGILLSADSVVLADASGTHGSITRDGIKTNNYTRYVTAQNDTQNLPLVMGLERIGNIVMVSFNFVTYGSTIRADAIQMNGPKIPVGFRPVDNVHIQAHANNAGTTIGTITFTITPEGKVLQTSPAINGIARIKGSGVYLTYSVAPSVGTKVDGSTGNTTA